MSEIRQLTSYYLLTQFGGAKSGKKWSTLSHNGVIFAPLYVPHNIPIIYDGKSISLPPLAEEYCTLYAKYIDSEYAKNKVFRKNFFKSWKPSIKGLNIEKMDLCDFSKIVKHLNKINEDKKSMSKSDKDRLKDEQNKIEEKYKVAIVDGKEQLTGNFRIEPPGIFIGRGCHPKIGTIKTRILPKDITINIGKGEMIPELPSFYQDKKYKKIVHNNKAEWLASWKDNISGKTKYVWLGHQSEFKAKSDQDKFDKARKLGKHINKIRKTNINNMINGDDKTIQLATALYLIDHLALRVGNEKGDDEADTVGVTSLRYEHIVLKGDNVIKLDFLGKDSVRYVNQVQVIKEVYNNLEKFMHNKNIDHDLFDLINSSELNLYIKTLMPDFTAKVFRTFNASYTFQSEINAINDKYENYSKSDKIDMLLSSFNIANAKVALLCNHQKAVSKGHDEGMKKLKDKMLEYKKTIEELLKDNSDKSKKKIKKLKEQVKKYKMKKESKIALKNISLGTSKINYIDPRISVAFLKKHDIPVEKIFTQTLRDKFSWAFSVDEDFHF
jgi:DNA topoisomerase-1